MNPNQIGWLSRGLAVVLAPAMGLPAMQWGAGRGVACRDRAMTPVACRNKVVTDVCGQPPYYGSKLAPHAQSWARSPPLGGY